MALVDMPTRGGFFTAADFADYPALLIEVNRWEPDRPGGNFGPKDTAHVDVTAFDAAGLVSGTPVKVAPGVMVQGVGLAPDLSGMVGNATVARIGQSKPKAGQRPAWIWAKVEPSAKQAVAAYMDARDAAAAAILADDDTPDFLK